ncbi:MAG: hypothetical protein M1118_14155 [Chloroflexi bacterium]|nr:hypothetical protein [Chloroflexota bacterium]
MVKRSSLSSDRIAAHGFHILKTVVPRVPFHTAQGLGKLVGRLTYVANAEMRCTSLHNLSRLLDEPETSEAVRQASIGAFQTLALNYVDMLATSHLSPDRMRCRTTIAGFEHLLAAQEQGKGVLIATAHLGSIDQGGQALIVRGARCAVLVEHVSPEWLFQFFIRERRRYGGLVISLESDAVSKIQQALDGGLAVGIACDWDPQSTGTLVRVPPLRSSLRIPSGIAVLSLRNHAPIVPIWVERLPSGRSRVIVEPPVDVDARGGLRAAVQHTAELIAARLITQLRARPHQWVLFHRVWE